MDTQSRGYVGPDDIILIAKAAGTFNQTKEKRLRNVSTVLVQRYEISGE